MQQKFRDRKLLKNFRTKIYCAKFYKPSKTKNYTIFAKKNIKILKFCIFSSKYLKNPTKSSIISRRRSRERQHVRSSSNFVFQQLVRKVGDDEKEVDAHNRQKSEENQNSNNKSDSMFMQNLMVVVDKKHVNDYAALQDDSESLKLGDLVEKIRKIFVFDKKCKKTHFFVKNAFLWEKKEVFLEKKRC
jgi:hypothetical protein